MLQRYVHTPSNGKGGNGNNRKGGKRRKTGIIPMLTLALCCLAALNQSLTFQNSSHGNVAFLRSRWERFLLYFSDPKTKIYRKSSDGTEVGVDVIVMVMGEASGFQKWYDNMKDIEKNNADLVLVYASYDDDIPNLEDFHQANIEGLNTGRFVDFDVKTIKDSTWPEGRNILAAEALRKEKLRGKEFDYWFFLDDNVEPICHPVTDKVFGKGSCWQKVFNFLGSEAVPEKASTVVLPTYLKDGFVATSNVNGFNAAFKRSHVPYLLPYATLQPGLSDWISQAANMCIINSCMANTVTFIPLIHAGNTKYREQSRVGYNIVNIHAAITESFHDKSIDFLPCQEFDKLSDFQEGEFSSDKSKLLGPYQTGAELNQYMSYTNTSYCTPLRNRFAEWEENILSEVDAETKEIIEDEKAKKEHIKMDIIVMVMGEASAFQGWLERLQDITDVRITFIFGSYDAEVILETNINNPESNNDVDESTKEDLYFHTLYLDKKTWTEGRNRLAEEALRMEKLRAKQFSYWFFLDDDVEPVCHPGSVKVLGGGSCWQKIFNFISGDEVPEKATTIVLPWFAKEGFASASNADALFAAFKRDTIPYLMPYATLKKGISEWISQASNFCVMGTCLTNSSVYVPYVSVKNTKSRPYVREGFSIQNIHATVTHNYHSLEPNFIPCHDWNTIAYYAQGEHGTGVVGPFETTEELNQRIPPHKYEFCAPLRNRFLEWEKNIMESLPDDSFTNETIPIISQGVDIM